LTFAIPVYSGGADSVPLAVILTAFPGRRLPPCSSAARRRRGGNPQEKEKEKEEAAEAEAAPLAARSA
jgi:hypothetical protein